MATPRQAMVIGNSAYHGVFALANPARDANAMVAVFAEMGIEVTSAIDLPYNALLDQVEKFISKANLSTTNTSILYYSGHGLQLKNINYMVPVDSCGSPGGELCRLVSVQSIVDRMTSATALRVVLLDACRTGGEAVSIVGGRAVEVDRAIVIDDVDVPPPGLAEMRTLGDTFIAFAAPPGQVARDGIDGSRLSPFTTALVRHLGSVDLPLANLFARVREEVLEATSNAQRTWDQSSMTVPFYFRPGSLIMLVGNMMALLGLCVSTVTYSLVLLSPKSTTREVIAAAALPLVSLTILLTGAQRAYERLRGVAPWARRPAIKGSFPDALRRGTVGGFLGALIGSGFLAASYYGRWAEPEETFGQAWLEIAYGTAFAACCVGAASLGGRHAASLLLRGRSAAMGSRGWMFIGSSLGGALAGLIAAPPLTCFFGIMEDRPEMTPEILLPGAILSATIFVLAIVNFDLERLNGRRLLENACASLLALFAGVPIALVVFGPLYAFGVVQAVIAFMERNYDKRSALLEGGACYGIPTGLVLGAVIGLAILFTERSWGRSTARQED